MRLVSLQRSKVTSKTKRAAGMSATNGISAILKAWNSNSSPEEVFSLGVISRGKGQSPHASCHWWKT